MFCPKKTRSSTGITYGSHHLGHTSGCNVRMALLRMRVTHDLIFTQFKEYFGSLATTARCKVLEVCCRI